MVQSYAGDIGNMVVNATGNTFIAAFFVLAAFSFLCYKRGYNVLATMFVIYPVVIGIVTSNWLPNGLHGLALLGIGVLWGVALLKLVGSVTTSDVQKLYIICLCWNMALLLAGFGVVAADGSALNMTSDVKTVNDPNTPNAGLVSLGTNYLTLIFSLLGGMVSFMLLGSVGAMLGSSGIPATYAAVIYYPLLAMGLLSLVPVFMQLVSLAAQLAGVIAGGIGKVIGRFIP
jgi:hypothetical protein